MNAGVVLAQVGMPFTMAVGGGYVYWTDFTNNSVMRVLTGGDAGVAETIASMQPAPIGISVLSPHLAWANHGTGAAAPGDVRTCNIFGNCMPPTIISGAAGAWGVALDATTAYFTQPSLGTVKSVPIGGGTPKTLVTIAPSTPQDIVVDANNVYFTTGGAGQVMSCALAGCGSAPTVLASMEPGPAALAVDATTVYWVDQNSGNVMKCAISGCPGTPPMLASGGGSPTAIAVDATDVYWATGGTGNIMKVPVGGGPAVKMVSGLVNATALAIDATYVYYADGGNGKIFKLAK
jgi:hypothetical protein